MEERLPDRRDVVKFDKDEFLHFDLDLVNSEWLFFPVHQPCVGSKRLC